ncbi:CRAL-TRIO domain-containing protein [Lipomyces tetrasporus]|uniref:Phosphatidylinositol transfer protein SFH5 n=1 Tax=Lipomyces tetrasporus TaxID=54092 RepID=A0AAD7QW54_9ASCO|nr:CRAL-TRIO domain-containing protein [Lipomyces tetrasporus]KAJ8102612.1 CRAL-TRIO domain-containing protein [Lipomyces tetrasporus]
MAGSAEAPAHLSHLSETQLTSFNDLISALPALLKEAEYSELYGHDLSEQSTTTDVLVLKFLVANKYAVPEARQQLLETLEWRKTFKPLSAAFEETHASKFDGLGYITEDKTKPEGEVITWNLYGQAAGKPEVVFGDTDQFLRWRVGIMEKGLQLLDFSSKRTQVSQVHDYSNVSFLRMDPNAKKASKAAVTVFQRHYPELLGKKYFVNVPLIMGWMFTAMKLIVSRETIEKFVVLSYGSYLAEYAGAWIPQVYGGQGQSLAEQDLSLSIKLPDGYKVPEPAVEESKAESAEEPATAAT